MAKLEHSPPLPFLSSQEPGYYPESSGSTVPFETDVMLVGATTMDKTGSTAMMPDPIAHTSVSISAEESAGRLSTASSESPETLARGERSSCTASPEPGLEILGRGMRDMVEVINRLRQVGVEDFVLPLPKIAVVGNQSAGKSSLIEAISGIRVPRHTGTCTRCPLEINLTESAYAGSQWTCRVSLGHKFFHNPPGVLLVKSELPSDMPTYQCSSTSNLLTGSLGPWVERSIAEDIHFKDIFNKSEVENVLVRAQKAILNPSQDWKRFLAFSPTEDDDREKEDFEVKFSPNVVRMNISGPGLPNLSFVDLPGIIEAPETDNEMYLVPLIKELVRGYIDNKDCLVLLAVPMTDDAENQSASSIAKQICKERCIGALTKPDMVQPGEHGKWKKILEGYKHELEHGYFVTKQPPQARLKGGIDHATARREEHEFFKTHEPWKSELSNARDRFGKPLQDRFGTLALQNYLSQTLTKLIRRRLPDIRARVTEEAERVNKGLLSLPEPPATDLVRQLGKKLMDLQWAIEHATRGSNGHNKLNEEWSNAADKFAETITSSWPRLKLSKDTVVTPKRALAEQASQRIAPRTPGTPTPQRPRTKAAQQTICLDSDDDIPSQALPKGRKRLVASDTLPSTPAAKRVKKVIEGQSVAQHNGIAKVFTLEEIRRESRRVSNSRMRHQLDPRATEHLAVLAIGCWDEPARRFLTQTGQIFRHIFKEAISNVFHNYRNTALFREVNSITESFLEEQVLERSHAVDTYYRLELGLISPIKDLTLEKQACLRSLEKEREQARREEAEHQAQTRRQQIEDSTTTPQQKAKLAKLLNSNAPTACTEEDEFRNELEYLANVRAYYDHAAVRFAETVCASIHQGIFVACRESLPKLLSEKLGIDEPGADERCKRLMVENDDREKQRTDLREKKKMLGKALDELARLD